MLSLGIDTSNYATSMAVVSTNSQEVVCALKRFLPVQKGQLGLRQSDALFHHTAALPALLDELSQKLDMTHIAAIGVSEKPRPVEGSYMPCFLAGCSFAGAFAAGRGIPLCFTSHQQGHLAAAMHGAQFPANMAQDFLFFHLSGGTTEWALASGYQVREVLGGSLDLYAGQAVDRLGVRLGFQFPAGVEVSALAHQCQDEVHPKVTVRELNCHFSGLQNQCEALLESGKTPAYVAKYCLQAVAATLAKIIQNLRKTYGELPVLCAGGVMCSEHIRTYLQQHCRKVWFAPPEYSSDNAIGVALIAAQEAMNG